MVTKPLNPEFSKLLKHNDSNVAENFSRAFKNLKRREGESGERHELLNPIKLQLAKNIANLYIVKEDGYKK